MSESEIVLKDWMMLDGDERVFPNVVVDLLFERAPLTLPVQAVFKRPMRATDLDQSVTVYSSNWRPDVDSKEIGFHGPSVEKYEIGMQALIKDLDRDRGANRLGVLSELLRTFIYSDDQLRLGLGQLSTSFGGMTKKVQKIEITKQNYFVGKPQNRQFMYLSEMTLTVDVQIIK